MPRNRPAAQPAWLKPGRAGGAILRTRNPYGNPCPQCGARRYERCTQRVGGAAIKWTEDEIAQGYAQLNNTGEFIYIKDKPCHTRVPLVLGIGYDDDNERNEGLSDDEYSGGDS
jgi:hypothetical protein